MMLCQRRYSTADLFSKNFFTLTKILSYVYLNFLFFSGFCVHTYKGVSISSCSFFIPKMLFQINN